MPNKRKKSESDTVVGGKNKIARIEPEGANVVIGNPGFPDINQNFFVIFGSQVPNVIQASVPILEETSGSATILDQEA